MTLQSTSSATTASKATDLDGLGLTLRACGAGLLVVALMWGVAELLLDEAVLPPKDRFYLRLGVAVGLFTGSLGNALFAFAASRPPGDPQNSTAMLRAIVVDFGLQFFTAGAGMVGLYFSDVKFAALAAFGVAFAAVATGFRVVGSAICTRALTQRARAHAQARSQAADSPAQEPPS